MSLTISHALQLALKALQDVHIYVAYSGGLDSQVLLHALAQYAKTKPFELTALHVNYGFSPNAGRWQDFCEQRCKALGVSILVNAAELDTSVGNLEQRARDFRYQWFESLMTQNTGLLTAHHQDDQAETVLLRLLRASGVHGLAAIPSRRDIGQGQLLRPFLDLSKADLQAYADCNSLQWIKDESNESELFERNFVRHQVLPLLTSRWPQASKLLARSANHCREDQALINEFSELDTKFVRADKELTWFDVLPPLDISKFSTLSVVRQRNLLQYILRCLSVYPLSSAKLSEWLAQVAGHTAENNSQLPLASLVLQIYDGRMHFLRSISKLPKHELNWRIDKPLPIPALACELSAKTGEVPRKEDGLPITLHEGDHVCVHWRQGGERVQLQGETFTRSLKKMLQEQRVAPWLRRALPLLSVGEHIVWSAALGYFSPMVVDACGKTILFELTKNKTDSA